MCTDLPLIRARDGPVSLAVPLWSCSLLPPALPLAGVESPPSASLSPSLRSLGLSLSVCPLSPRASPYSHPQSHVMTLGLTHLGRGHIPYSAPRIYYIECATWHTHSKFKFSKAWARGFWNEKSWSLKISIRPY